MVHKFQLHSKYQPNGDQPQAIDKLVAGLKEGEKDQVLLGVTGSGKTFTMANVIEKTNRPALILAHNKTLAAQLYSEMKEFFPNNAVEYFVSYYDYYQPEAYIAKTDTYIEKDSAINEHIDLMRHSATRNLLERRDCIVVASVSCIYGIGSPQSYGQMTAELKIGDKININDLTKQLIELAYERNEIDFARGKFKLQGDILDIFPSHYDDRAWRLSFFGDDLEEISEFDPLTGEKLATLESIKVFANSHYVTPRPTLIQAIEHIKIELKARLDDLYKMNKLVEAQRLEQRTQFDLEMIFEAGTCKGIENYSRFLSGRLTGEPPPTLFEYLPKDALLFVDESHVTVSQIGAMYKGDASRKNNLVDYGFRLPSAKDNRPLKFEEWENLRPQTVFVSATPSKFEMDKTGGVFVQQIIRPTGLVDPVCEIKPVATQVDDLIAECKKEIAKNNRVLVTALTKRMAEDLSEYMSDAGIKVTYLHSDVQTLERVAIIQDLRKGVIDVLIGVNLLREGLDIPECSLVAILDADKEGFLRSETSLIQTIGRAARNIDGRVILYADKITGSMERALGETTRRRNLQLKYNEDNNITPATISRNLVDSSLLQNQKSPDGIMELDINEIEKTIANLRKEMLKYAGDLEFEKAASIRNQIISLENQYLGIKS